MESTESNVQTKSDAPAVATKQKQKQELCEWCGGPAQHRFETPQLVLCCKCVDVAIEHSAFLNHSNIELKNFKDIKTEEQEFWKTVKGRL